MFWYFFLMKKIKYSCEQRKLLLYGFVLVEKVKQNWSFTQEQSKCNICKSFTTKPRKNTQNPIMPFQLNIWHCNSCLIPVALDTNVTDSLLSRLCFTPHATRCSKTLTSNDLEQRHSFLLSVLLLQSHP